MLAPSSASKYTNFQFELTPAKLTVNYEINSWNETLGKQQVVYRHKRKKILRAAEHSQTREVDLPNNLAQLRTYKDHLLKSTAKKLAERTIPPTEATSHPSTNLTSHRHTPFRFHVRSLSRSNQNKQEKQIVVSDFDPNAEERNPNELKL
jgi:hypothetical protein